MIIVTGLPRSGTSLCMQMLGAAGVPLFVDDAKPPDIDNPLGYFEHSAVVEGLSWIPAAKGHAVKVLSSVALETLPDDLVSRYIVVDRPNHQVIASHLATLDRYPRPLLGVRDPEGFAVVLKHQKAMLSAWLVGKSHIVLSYPMLVARHRTELNSLADFTGLDVFKLAAPIDPSLHRNR